VLADYGLVFVIETTDFTSTKTAGTCRWMAPEVMNPADELLEDQDPPVLFTMDSDIYAFGMTAFEVRRISFIWMDLGIIIPLRSCLGMSPSVTRKRIAL
jgi:serine/threonine protein kinase